MFNGMQVDSTLRNMLGNGVVMTGMNPLLEGALQTNGQDAFSSMQDYGLQLANGKWRGLCESIESTHEKAYMATLLENTDRYFKSLNETTLTANIGTFEKFAFPMIRAIFANTVSGSLVSKQPLSGPIGLIFWMDYIFGSTKGAQQTGEIAVDSGTGPNDSQYYSSEDVVDEPLGTGTGSATNFTGTCSYLPVQRSSFSVTAGSINGFDDGAGSISGTGIAAGTIDYTTGAIDVTFSVAPVNALAITQTYRYDGEAQDNVPQMDLQLTSSPVVAKYRKLQSQWSIESAASLNSLHGVDVEKELLGVLANQIGFEIDREIINALYNGAMAGHVAWDSTVPAGVSYTEHKLSYVTAQVQMSNLVFRQTKRGMTNWIVASIDTCNVIETLPSFVGNINATKTQSGAGVINTGVLDGKWQIFKDPYLGIGQSNSNISVAGYLGPNWLDAGFVHATFLPLFTTPPITLPDFKTRRGMGSAYGTRFVNPRFYVTGSIV